MPAQILQHTILVRYFGISGMVGDIMISDII
jgi:hypothetical protein